MPQSLILMSLRGLTLLTKFALTLFLTKFLSLAELGQYGLIVAGTMLYSTIAGLAILYSVSRDSVLASRRQICAHLLQYTKFLGFLFPITLLLGALAAPVVNAFSFTTSLIISALLFFEMVNQNAYGLLINIEQPFTANLLHFLRSSLWDFLYIALAYYYPDLRTIDVVLLFWLVASILTTLLLLYVFRTWPWEKSDLYQPFLPWLQSQFKACSAAYKEGIVRTIGDYSSPFIIGSFLSFEALGIYVYLTQATAALRNLILIGVVQLYRPMLINALKKSHTTVPKIIANKLKVVTLLGVAFSIIAYPSYLWLTDMLDKTDIMESYWLFIPILLAFIVSLRIIVIDTALYCYKRDDHLLKVSGISLIVNFICKGIGVSIFGLPGVVFADLISMAAMLYVRHHYIKDTYNRYTICAYEPQ